MSQDLKLHKQELDSAKEIRTLINKWNEFWKAPENNEPLTDKELKNVERAANCLAGFPACESTEIYLRYFKAQFTQTLFARQHL